MMALPTSPVTEKRTQFSLLTEDWIPVVFKDLEYKNVSLQYLFLHWDDLKTVQAANPPRTVALWRWLIAFTQWSIQGPATVDEWAALWTDENFGNRIVERLETVRDRLDLLHPKYPFGQCLDLLAEAKDKEPSPSEKLIYQDKETGLLWSHHNQWQPALLSYAEGCQELLRLLCCDLGGTKSDSKNRSAETGSWMSARVIMPIGESVKETLLLNLYKYDSNLYKSKQNFDLPLWEQSKIGKGLKKVNGLLYFLSFPGRRVLLSHNGENIVGAYLYRGEELAKSSPNPTEKTIIEANKLLDKWQAYVNDMTLKLKIEKSSWRDAEAFLHPTSERNHRPRIFDWLLRCRKSDFIPNPLPVQVFGFANEVGKQAKPLQWVHDTMTIPQIYLDSEDAYHQLVRALKYAEDIGKIFSGKTYGPVADALDLSKKDRTKFINNISAISSSYWSALDSEFQQFMNELSEDTEFDEDDEDITYGKNSIPKWKQKLRKISTELYEESLSGISSYKARAKGLNKWHFELKKILEKK